LLLPFWAADRPTISYIDPQQTPKTFSPPPYITVPSHLPRLKAEPLPAIALTMAPHLLSLSGEIRNTIYEFALTEDDGICYGEDAGGVDWLRTYHIGKYIKSEDSFEDELEFDDDDLDDEDFGDAAFTNAACTIAAFANKVFDDEDFDDEDFGDATAKGMRKAITPCPESDGQECLPSDETTNPEKPNGTASIEPGNYIVSNQLQLSAASSGTKQKASSYVTTPSLSRSPDLANPVNYAPTSCRTSLANRIHTSRIRL
jgi:hypothetical protein